MIKSICSNNSLDQYYCINLTDTDGYDGVITSTLAITFHEESHRRLTANYWRFWLGQQQDPQSARALDLSMLYYTKAYKQCKCWLSSFFSPCFDRCRSLLWYLQCKMSRVWSCCFWVEWQKRSYYPCAIQLLVDWLFKNKRCQRHSFTLAYGVTDTFIWYQWCRYDFRSNLLQDQAISG